ncbi:MAG TPA: CpcT/CpeT family chromophore lyase [Steroidobacteraceae bacterium]
MAVLPGLAALAAVAAAATGPAAQANIDVDTLMRLWPGIRDSTEQTLLNPDTGVVGWAEGQDRRVRTAVASIKLPWLGEHVLYLEEFPQDEPDAIRRQMVLQVEPQRSPEEAVRVHLYAFAEPARWPHLDRRPKLSEQLRQEDLVAIEGCDLVLRRDGDRFRGGTLGNRCRDAGASDRYVEYQVVVGSDIYWYRRRILRSQDDELSEEVIGYNWFEPNAEQLYSCRVDWSASGRAADQKPLVRLDLADQGGRGTFTTPDGRALELTLHSQDWPFSGGERDSLLLMLRPQGSDEPISSAWAEVDIQLIELNIGWLRVRCGPLVPDTDEVRS